MRAVGEVVSMVPTLEELQARALKALQTIATSGKQLNIDPLYLAHRLEAIERLLRESNIDLARLDYLTELCRTEDLEDKARGISPIMTALTIPTRPA